MISWEEEIPSSRQNLRRQRGGVDRETPFRPPFGRSDYFSAIRSGRNERMRRWIVMLLVFLVCSSVGFRENCNYFTLSLQSFHTRTPTGPEGKFDFEKLDFITAALKESLRLKTYVVRISFPSKLRHPILKRTLKYQTQVLNRLAPSEERHGFGSQIRT